MGETFEFWTAECGFGNHYLVLMPRLCCCAQKLGFYIPLKLMRAVSGRMWLF